MRTLKIVPAPPPEEGQGHEGTVDLRDYPLKLKLGVRPLDLMSACRFDEIRDDGLLLELAATTPSDAGISPIRSGETHRTVVARPFFIARNLSTAAVLEAIRSHGARPADPTEFLAFAAQHPELQRSVPVVTLGWSRQDGRWTKYPMLTADVRRRRILRSVNPPSWSKDWRYLIVVS